MALDATEICPLFTDEVLNQPHGDDYDEKLHAYAFAITFDIIAKKQQSVLAILNRETNNLASEIYRKQTEMKMDKKKKENTIHNLASQRALGRIPSRPITYGQIEEVQRNFQATNKALETFSIGEGAEKYLRVYNILKANAPTIDLLPAAKANFEVLFLKDQAERDRKNAEKFDKQRKRGLEKGQCGSTMKKLKSTHPVAVEACQGGSTSKMLKSIHPVTVEASKKSTIPVPVKTSKKFNSTHPVALEVVAVVTNAPVDETDPSSSKKVNQIPHSTSNGTEEKKIGSKREANTTTTNANKIVTTTTSRSAGGKIKKSHKKKKRLQRETNNQVMTGKAFRYWRGSRKNNLIKKECKAPNKDRTKNKQNEWVVDTLENRDIKTKQSLKIIKEKGYVAEVQQEGKTAYQCKFDTCQSVLGKASDANSHVRNYHLFPYSYKCYFCGKKFPLYSHAILHLSNHHPTQIK